MSYTKQTWTNGVSGGTPTSASRFNHMEDGIEDADTRISALATVASTGDYDDLTNTPPSGVYTVCTSTTRPETPVAGQNIYETDTGLSRMYRDDLDEWVELAVPSNLVDAKGDLLVGDANDSTKRLAVGSDGSVLMADSSQTLGVRWGSGVKPFPPVDLTDASTIATNAALGTHFRCSLSGSRTLGAPTNPTDGQVAVWELTASTADRTVTLASGTGGFAFGTDVTEVPTISSGTTIYIQAVYRSSASRWRVIGVVGGF